MKRFGSFRLDPVNQCLWRDDRRVALTPKAFDVLRYLVEHSGRLITHDELLEALWPETYVNPELIKKYILGIRKVLGDQHESPTFIETIPKRGYQFVAPVTDEVVARSSDLSPRASPKVVARDGPIRELNSAYTRALGGDRQVIFVSGEAGIGKTTLVDLFHQHLALKAGGRVARGQCIEGFGGKEPYHPVLDALSQLNGTTARDQVLDALGTRAPTWLAQFPSLVKAEQKTSLQKEILGATRERMVRELCDVLDSLSSETPLVFVLEDLHWADPSTIDVISALARRRAAAKLMLIVTYRPVDVILSNNPFKLLKQDLQVHGLSTEIALEPLGASDARQFLTAHFPDARFPSGLADLLFRHSGGNPLFMTAITHELTHNGAIAFSDGQWLLRTPLEALDPGVPSSLKEMMEVQFESLNEREQRTLELASVVGDLFSGSAVSTILNERPDVIEDICDQLAARQQMINSRGTQALPAGSFTALYGFRHSLYRQAIYRRISPAKRTRLHRAAAEYLSSLGPATRRDSAAAIAFHFEAGQDFERATQYLITTAENAAARFAYRESILVLQHALTLLENIESYPAAPQLEAHIHEFIGDAQYALGAMSQATTSYRSAASRAQETRLDGEQVSALCAIVRPFGFIDPDEGVAALRRAEEVAKRLKDPRVLARTQMLAAGYRLLYDCWRKEDAVLCDSAHEQLVQMGDIAIPSYHEMIYAHVQALKGDYCKALATFEKGMPTFSRPTSMMEHFFALSGKTVVFLTVGRLGEVLSIVRDGKSMAEKNGNDPWLFNFREAWLRMLVLDFEGSVQVCESITRKSEPSLTVQPETIARIARGYAAIAGGFAKMGRGDHERAIASFSDVRDEYVTPKFFLHWLWRMIAQRGLSEAWLRSKQIEKASREADSHLQSALQSADPHLQALAWELQARVASAQEKYAQADESIQKAVEILRRFDVPVAGWQVHATAWQLCSAKKAPAESERHRQQAAAYITKIANSFSPEEPLRQKFLSSEPVAKVLGGGAVAQSARTG